MLKNGIGPKIMNLFGMSHVRKAIIIAKSGRLNRVKRYLIWDVVWEDIRYFCTRGI